MGNISFRHQRDRENKSSALAWARSIASGWWAKRLDSVERPPAVPGTGEATILVGVTWFSESEAPELIARLRAHGLRLLAENVEVGVAEGRKRVTVPSFEIRAMETMVRKTSPTPGGR